jgi:hypothetical protein
MNTGTKRDTPTTPTVLQNSAQGCPIRRGLPWVIIHFQLIHFARSAASQASIFPVRFKELRQISVAQPLFLTTMGQTYKALSNRIKVNRTESNLIKPRGSQPIQIPQILPPPRPAPLFPPLRTHFSNETEIVNDTFELPCRRKRTSIPPMSPLRHH